MRPVDVPPPPQSVPQADPMVRSLLSLPPLPFVENHGQVDERVAFTGQAGAMTAYYGPGIVAYGVRGYDPDRTEPAEQDALECARLHPRTAMQECGAAPSPSRWWLTQELVGALRLRPPRSNGLTRSSPIWCASGRIRACRRTTASCTDRRGRALTLLWITRLARPGDNLSGAAGRPSRRGCASAGAVGAPICVRMARWNCVPRLARSASTRREPGRSRLACGRGSRSSSRSWIRLTAHPKRPRLRSDSSWGLRPEPAPGDRSVHRLCQLHWWEPG